MSVFVCVRRSAKTLEANIALISVQGYTQKELWCHPTLKLIYLDELITQVLFEWVNSSFSQQLALVVTRYWIQIIQATPSSGPVKICFYFTQVRESEDATESPELCYIIAPLSCDILFIGQV